jgi:hypothetical protein
VWSRNDDASTRRVHVTTLGEFGPVASLQDRVVGIDFHSSDLDAGVAVSDVGRIYRTTDGGRSWSEVLSPVAPGRKVRGYLGLNQVKAVTATVWWACGQANTLLKSTDAGLTWKVTMSNMPQTAFDAEDVAEGAIFPGGTLATNPSRTLNAMAWRSEQIGWVVGGGTRIIHTNDGGATWKTVVDYRGRYGLGFTGIAAIDDTTILVGGSIGVFDVGEVADANNKKATLAKLTNADTETPTLTFYPFPSFEDEIASMGRYSTTVYAITRNNGLLYKWTDASGAWERRRFKITGWETQFRLPRRDRAVVQRAAGHRRGHGRRRWEAHPPHARWWGHAGHGHHPARLPLRVCAALFDEDTGVVGADGGIGYGDNVVNHRVYGDSLALPGGVIIIALANLTIGEVEIYRSTDGGESFTLLPERVTFPAYEATAIPEWVPTPSLDVDDFGQVLLMAPALGASTSTRQFRPLQRFRCSARESCRGDLRLRDHHAQHDDATETLPSAVTFATPLINKNFA